LRPGRELRQTDLFARVGAERFLGASEERQDATAGAFVQERLDGTYFRAGLNPGGST